MLVRPFHAVLRLHIELEGIEPVIWRRLLVRSDQTLHELHEIVQIAMGWQSTHVYLFEQSGTTWAEPAPDWTIDDDSREVAVHAVLRKPGDVIDYIYDMGDEWLHTIRVEDVVRDAPPALLLPCCEDGARACPPEDTGGAIRYMTMLEALADPRHEEHEQWREWIGEFDPEPFSAASVNAMLLDHARQKAVRARDAARLSGPAVTAAWKSAAATSQSMVMLQRAVHMMDEVMRAQSLFTAEIREHAVRLLTSRHDANPGEFARSFKPGVWAAAAVHAAFTTIPSSAGRAPDHHRLASMFDVSDTAVLSRSARLRGIE